MTIKFIGDTFNATERVLTGLSSLDWSLGDALGNRGWPIHSFVETYGDKNCGKTTFIVSIAGILAKYLERDIVFMDWEGQDKNTISGVLENSGYQGTVDYVLNLAKEKSEETVARLIKKMYADPQPITLMDSLGAFRPTANMEGDLQDANMGAMARESGRMADWVIAALQRAEHPGCFMMTNHEHPKIGFRVVGNDTAGGVKKKYLAQLRISLKRTWLKAKKSGGDGDDEGGGSIVDFGESWLLGGRIDSSRFGYSKREFQVFMIGGEGIHTGLSAMFDCIANGQAEVSSKKITDTTTVTFQNKSYGKMKTIIANRADSEQFSEFINTLRAEQVDTVSNEDDTPKKRGKKSKK